MYFFEFLFSKIIDCFMLNIGNFFCVWVLDKMSVFGWKLFNSILGAQLNPALLTQAQMRINHFTTKTASDALKQCRPTKMFLSTQLREMCCKNCNLLDLPTEMQFLEKKILSPHVPNGDKVGQHCSKKTIFGSQKKKF